MFQIILTYIVALVVFFAIDICWLALVAKKLYRSQIGFIMSDKPNWPAAIVFYMVFLVGMVYFAIYPAIEKGSFSSALFVGMFYGFITYATYDLTNLATLKNWPLKITIIDLIWGTSLGGLVSGFTYLIIGLL